MRRLALVAGLLVATAAGGATAGPVPSSGSGLEVSPDGRFVLLVRERSGNRYARSWEAWAVGTSGGRARLLLPVSERPITGTWTRDGLARITTGGRVYFVRPADAVVVDEERAPDWQEAEAPDGQRFARVRGDTLYIGDRSGIGTAVVSGRSFHQFCWSPDSRRLAYVVALRGYREALEVVRADGTGGRRLYVAAAALGCGSWSPDARRLAFMAQHGVDRYYPPHVYVADVASGRVRLLTKAQALSPVWSPRGEWIAFVRLIHGKLLDRWDLVAIRSDGSGARQLAALEWLAPHAWLPDGARIVTCLRKGVGIVSLGRRAPRLLPIRC